MLIKINESFVDVSPSTEIQLKLFSHTSEISSFSKSLGIFISTAIKANIVAIFGYIMPDPLHIPVIVTSLSFRLIIFEYSFGSCIGSHD